MSQELPINIARRKAIENNQFAQKYAVHKRNSYIKDRTITLEEALRCVILQSKWASSHKIGYVNTEDAINVSIAVTQNIDLTDSGQFVCTEINTDSEKYTERFIVTESETHWYIQDMALLSCSSFIEIK